ncbi:hypothetical protein Ciccas_008781 [Cichlidogyrus casuarinus]|uniref:Uncharacterized protein n=1 Tax=Cichlidogyrus casuarinus TaxID=1844966 RepID=A0ABD2PZI5_9PLAT
MNFLCAVLLSFLLVWSLSQATDVQNVNSDHNLKTGLVDDQSKPTEERVSLKDVWDMLDSLMDEILLNDEDVKKLELYLDDYLYRKMDKSQFDNPAMQGQEVHPPDEHHTGHHYHDPVTTSTNKPAEDPKENKTVEATAEYLFWA